jgi:glycosyltransferase involved in cell wall biosynthesis
LISVVIPTCNRSDFLDNSVRCVLTQSTLPDELIIVNNGINPIDDSIYDNKLISIINIMSYAGVSQARNFGVIYSKSDYIAFLDDDDMWENNYISKVKDLIDNNHPDLIISRLDQLTNNEILPFKDSSNYPELEAILSFNPGYVGSSTIIKRESFLKVGGYDVKLITSEDKSLVIEMMLRKLKIIRTSNIQSILRQHDGERLTNNKTMYKGICSFYGKYKHLMSRSIKLFNKVKIYKYKWEYSKSISSLFFYLFYGFIYFWYKKLNK